MEISRIRTLRGPNRWTRRMALEATVACAATDTEQAAQDFEQQINLRFPDIGLLQPASQEPGIAQQVLALGTAALALQAQAGCPVTFLRCVATEQTGIYLVIVEYTEETVGQRALKLALQLCDAARNQTPWQPDTALAALRELDESVRLGPSTGAIVQAAVARGIPYRRLTSGSLVQFGWGRRQRRIQAAETDQSSAIAEAIAQDKELTKQILHAAGVPVPQGQPVESAEDAWRAALEIGLPVVVKPRDGNQGKGVTVNLTQRDEVQQAYETAVKHRQDVMVERYLPGRDFRVLVVGGALIAAARRDPPQVVGDGIRSVSALIDEVNLDPRRGEGHATSLTRIRLDAIALATLAHQGLEPGSVPAPGVRVLLRNNANLSTGGTATDVTDDVHPEFAARAIAAAEAVGLDICGIDVVADSVTQPLEVQGGGVVEVNAAPGLRMHIQPSYGNGQPVGQAIVAGMFPPGDNGRIPIVAVTGTNGKTTTVRLAAHLLGGGDRCIGMTNSDGVWVGHHAIDKGDCSGPRSARRVLMHPDVDATVFETARGGMLREGLGFDRCDVAIVTNVGVGDHLGLDHVHTLDELAALKRIVVESVTPGGCAVLNAMDPLVVAMAANCPGQVVFFAADGNHPVLAAHRAQGLRVLYRDHDDLVAVERDHVVRLPLAGIPLTDGGRLPFQIENAMAAVAAAWFLGISWDEIRERLAGFTSDVGTTPGRFNRFDYQGAQVIADYGHNPDAMLALVQAIEQLPARSRTVVISGAGDRRDQDIRRQTEILGAAFDRIILFEDQCQRGRRDGEVLALLRQGLADTPRTRDVREVQGEYEAIDQGLEGLSEGDLCLVLVDQVDGALAHIQARVAEAAAQTARRL